MVTVIEKAMVQGAVKQFVDQRKMFTAFDVTLELRKGDPDVKHYIVREAVNEIYKEDDVDQLMGDYVRDLVDIPNKGSAFVYHLPENDASEYLKDQTQPISAPANIPAPKNTPKTIAVKRGCIFNGIKTTSGNRVNIGRKILNSIGIVDEGDEVLIRYDGNDHILIENPSIMKTDVVSKCVVRHHRIQFSVNFYNNGHSHIPNSWKAVKYHQNSDTIFLMPE